jgi:hypothetical protein
MILNTDLEGRRRWIREEEQEAAAARSGRGLGERMTQRLAPLFILAATGARVLSGRLIHV